MLAEVYTTRIEARRIVQSLAQTPTLDGGGIHPEYLELSHSSHTVALNEHIVHAMQHV